MKLTSLNIARRSFHGLHKVHPNKNSLKLTPTATEQMESLLSPVMNNSYNALHIAARNGSALELYRVIKKLEATSQLEKLINSKCSMGVTPLLLTTQAMVAFTGVRTDYPYVIRMLLRWGADPNLSDTIHNITPLHNAAQFSINVTECLTENGAKINFPNQNGNTALHWAIAANNDQSIASANYLVEQMVKKGIDPNSENVSGQTPLSLAKEINHESLIKKLQSVSIPESNRLRHKLS